MQNITLCTAFRRLMSPSLFYCHEVIVFGDYSRLPRIVLLHTGMVGEGLGSISAFRGIDALVRIPFGASNNFNSEQTSSCD